MIKVLGWEKYVEKFHSSWDDWQKRSFYRKIFGYKKYIEDHPNDWWELYNEDYLKFLEVDSEEMNYVLSLILEIRYKNPDLYFSRSFDDFVCEIFFHAADSCIIWFSKLAKEEEIAKSVELSKDRHFLVKDENTGNTVTFKYLSSFLVLAQYFPISNFNERLLMFKIPDYRLSHAFFKYFLCIDDPDDAFINIMLLSESEISEKARDAISSFETLVSKLDLINFEDLVKKQLFLNLNKLLDYFKVTFNNCEKFKKYIEKDKYFGGRKVDGEKNLTYDEANNILNAVKSEIENNNNNNNNNNPKINSQENNCLN